MCSHRKDNSVPQCSLFMRLTQAFFFSGDTIDEKTCVKRDVEIADKYYSITVKDEKFISQENANTSKQKLSIIFGFLVLGYLSLISAVGGYDI